MPLHPRTCVVLLLGPLCACGLFRGPGYKGSVPATPDARLGRFLEEVYLSRLDRDPSLREREGSGAVSREWTDRSLERIAVDRVLLSRELERSRAEFDPGELSDGAARSLAIFEFDAQRRQVEMVSEARDIEQSLWILLTTRPGERVMQPDYGCGIHALVFETMSESTLGHIEESITRAILFF